jgi:hypothetical protein
VDGGVDEPMFFVIDPERIAKANPFGEAECVVVEIEREVNVSQFTDEIETKVGHKVQVSLTNVHPDQPIGMDNPARLYVTPVVPEKLIAEAISEHSADELYGMPAGQQERLRLAAKLEAGEELTIAEVNQALRLILAQ